MRRRPQAEVNGPMGTRRPIPLSRNPGGAAVALAAASPERRQRMAKERETSLKGRDARNGQFIPVKEARERPNTTTVERVPLPGKGRR